MGYTLLVEGDSHHKNKKCKDGFTGKYLYKFYLLQIIDKMANKNVVKINSVKHIP